MKQELWIGKCKTANGHTWYDIAESKNDWIDTEGFPDRLYSFCNTEKFERITGLKFKLGEVRKIKSIKIELEPK